MTDIYYHLCEEGSEQSSDPKDFLLVNATTQKQVSEFLDTYNWYDAEDARPSPDEGREITLIEYANMLGLNVVTTNHPI